MKKSYPQKRRTYTKTLIDPNDKLKIKAAEEELKIFYKDMKCLEELM